VKSWQKALGDIRLLGPDIEPFREDVKYVYDYIEKLEGVLLRISTYHEPNHYSRLQLIAKDALDT
jgi:hypothetical protein